MRSIDSLIRIHKHQVDERQRALGALEGRRAELLQDLAQLDQEQQREMENAVGFEGGGAYYAAYAGGARLRREETARRMADLEAEIAVAQLQLREAFEALKKYEIVDDAAQLKKRLEEERDAQAALDELATGRAARR